MYDGEIQARLYSLNYNKMPITSALLLFLHNNLIQIYIL